jgi:hypothetical protein
VAAEAARDGRAAVIRNDCGRGGEAKGDNDLRGGKGEEQGTNWTNTGRTEGERVWDEEVGDDDGKESSEKE